MKKIRASLRLTVAMCLAGMLVTQAFAQNSQALSHQIDAPAERVWSVLLDFPGHTQWNPFIRQIQGRAEAGEKLHVQIQPVGGRDMAFSPTGWSSPRKSSAGKASSSCPDCLMASIISCFAPTVPGVFSGFMAKSSQACWSRSSGHHWRQEPALVLRS